ncbi:uncharacterized protein LOC131936882 [Physella acuta]|uniref:uncharacterized protein LOC131936882 n=1 Tax=Physella acuta TaxID=109671 RepID=UPI0027DD6522|nr:uncharacterized protein LOC131936882 [Physella acuta]
MKGLTRNESNTWPGLVITTSLLLLAISSAEGGCTSSTAEVWAYGNPSVVVFTDTYERFVTSDKSEKCKWIITAADSSDVVKLTFTDFNIKTTEKSKEGDCVIIYNGDSDDAPELDTLCDKTPGSPYTSHGRSLLVVYKRGEVEGDRKFSMEVKSKEVMSKEKIIRIAGIIGAVLAAFGLTFVILRATRCCSCLRKKSTSDPERNSSVRETTRLTIVSTDDPEPETIQLHSTNLPQSSGTSSTQNGTTASAPDGVEPGATAESDSDSLPDVDEPPPSYESLYLNELGETITPPNYSPPKHRSRHPPRRVHTIN